MKRVFSFLKMKPKKEVLKKAEESTRNGLSVYASTEIRGKTGEIANEYGYKRKIPHWLQKSRIVNKANQVSDKLSRVSSKISRISDKLGLPNIKSKCKKEMFKITKERYVCK